MIQNAKIEHNKKWAGNGNFIGIFLDDKMVKI